MAFPDHDFCGFDDRIHHFPDPEPQALGRAAGDHGGELLITYREANLGHQPLEGESHDMAGELIPGTEIQTGPGRDRSAQRGLERPLVE